MAERAGVPRHGGAHFEDLHQVVRAQRVVHHDHAVPGQHADPDRLAGLPGQPVGPGRGAGAQFRAVQICVAQLQDRRPQRVLAAVNLLHHQPVPLQRAQHGVHGRLRDIDNFGDLGYP